MYQHLRRSDTNTFVFLFFTSPGENYLSPVKAPPKRQLNTWCSLPIPTFAKIHTCLALPPIKCKA